MQIFSKFLKKARRESGLLFVLSSHISDFSQCTFPSIVPRTFCVRWRWGHLLDVDDPASWLEVLIGARCQWHLEFQSFDGFFNSLGRECSAEFFCLLRPLFDECGTDFHRLTLFHEGFQGSIDCDSFFAHARVLPIGIYPHNETSLIAPYNQDG